MKLRYSMQAWVKRTRNAHNQTQQQLAEKSGLSRSFIAGVEVGERKVDFDAYYTLCRTWCLDPGEELNGIILRHEEPFK